MKKSKGEKIDLLYSKPKPEKKQTNKPKSKKSTEKKRKSNDKKSSNKINLDNEIIIGLTPKKGEKSKKKQEEKKKVSTQPNGKKKSINTKRQAVKKFDKEFDKKRRVGKLKVIRRIITMLLIISCAIMFMLSSFFNIKEITVSSTSKLSAEEIIVSSGLEKNKNMFSINIWKIEEKLKQNPYIAEVKIVRHLNGTVNINVVERVPTYMIQILDKYAYINNQGYIVEISDIPIETPILRGVKTETVYIEPGKRLVKEDLEKLDTVIKIMESAKNNGIAKVITEIDISNSKEYILDLKPEAKVVYFGDAEKINQKMIWITKLIEEEKGIEGEIFFKNKNIDRAIFREKV